MLCPAHKISISHIWLPRKYRGREQDAKVLGETLRNARQFIKNPNAFAEPQSWAPALLCDNAQKMCP